MRYVLVSVMFFGLLGCTPFGGFKPPPMSWTYYLSNGVGESEIRIALLECGSNVPGEFVEFSLPSGKTLPFPRQRLNEIILVEKCMQNAGFVYNGDTSTCKRWEDLPACKPDAVIPKRSVENRLNSAYCKTYPEKRICQPVVVSEAEWSEIHKEEIEARRLKLEEVRRQGYSTSVGTGEIKYCVREAKKNVTQEEVKPHIEKCLKERFNEWNPLLDLDDYLDDDPY